MGWVFYLVGAGVAALAVSYWLHDFDWARDAGVRRRREVSDTGDVPIWLLWALAAGPGVVGTVRYATLGSFAVVPLLIGLACGAIMSGFLSFALATLPGRTAWALVLATQVCHAAAHCAWYWWAWNESDLKQSFVSFLWVPACATASGGYVFALLGVVVLTYLKR